MSGGVEGVGSGTASRGVLPPVVVGSEMGSFQEKVLHDSPLLPEEEDCSSTMQIVRIGCVLARMTTKGKRSCP